MTHNIPLLLISLLLLIANLALGVFLVKTTWPYKRKKP